MKLSPILPLTIWHAVSLHAIHGAKYQTNGKVSKRQGGRMALALTCISVNSQCVT